MGMLSDSQQYDATVLHRVSMRRLNHLVEASAHAANLLEPYDSGKTCRGGLG